MAKAVSAAVILAKGVPMLFMGQEAGEDRPFYFGMDDLNDTSRYLRLDAYEQPGEMNRILTWSRHLLGLRNNPDNGLRGDDDQRVQNTPKTLTPVPRRRSILCRDRFWHLVHGAESGCAGAAFGRRLQRNLQLHVASVPGGQ